MIVNQKRVWPTGIVLGLLVSVVIGGGALAIIVANQWNGISALENHASLQQTNRESKGSDVASSQASNSQVQPTPPAPVVKPLIWQLAPEGQKLHSQSALIYDLTRGEKVFELNAQIARAPASLVKIMTVLVAIEQLPDLQARTMIPATVLNQMRQSNASVAGFVAGESVTVSDLLHGALLASGGDASYLLAEMAGGQARFVALMNHKALQLGMAQTHFINTTGLDHPEQVSSATDIAKMLQFALQHPTFRKVFESREYLYQGANRQLLISSTLFKRLPQVEINNLTVLGGKTGTTDRAGLCLASLVRRGERELLVITLGAPITAWPNPAPLHVADLSELLNHLHLIER